MLSDEALAKRAAQQRAYYQRNRERLQAEARRRYDAQRTKRSIILARYGLTVERHAELLENQGGVCAICRRPEDRLHPRTGQIQALSIDHDHTTGKVRGLLCNNCNRALGLFGDDLDRLRMAMDYLQGVVA